MRENENRQMVRQLLEGALSGDTEVVRSLVADAELADRIQAASDESRRLLPDQSFVIESMLAEGDHVSVQWVISGTYVSGIPGVFGPKRVELHGSYVATVQRGQVTALVQYSDQLDLLAQLGSRAIFFTALRTLFRKLVRRQDRQPQLSGRVSSQSGQTARATSPELVNL